MTNWTAVFNALFIFLIFSTVLVYCFKDSVNCLVKEGLFEVLTSRQHSTKCLLQLGSFKGSVTSELFK